MDDLINLIVAVIAALIIVLAVHSTYRHRQDREQVAQNIKREDYEH